MTGEELKAMRKVPGISQSALARLIGCSHGMVSLWETGKSPIGDDWSEKIETVFRARIPVSDALYVREKKSIVPEKEEVVSPPVVEGSSCRPAEPGNVSLSGESLAAVRKILREEIEKDILKDDALAGIRELIHREMGEIGRSIAAEIGKIGSPPAEIRLTPKVIASAREGERYRERCQEVLTGRNW